MNERIRELRHQAINYCMDKGSQGNLSEEVAEKFAELILQECCRVIDNHYEPVYDGRLLMKHFGVE